MRVACASFVFFGLGFGLTACVQHSAEQRYEEACFAETNVLEREKRGDAEGAGRDMVACLNRNYAQEAAATGKPIRQVVTFNGERPGAKPRSALSPGSYPARTPIPTIHTGGAAPLSSAAPAVASVPRAPIAATGGNCRMTMTGGAGYACSN